jgi:SNF2 family DNA or RNA helicase
MPGTAPLPALEGLAWLQYLREQDLSGILADDMGLGKTAQTLAHLLTEKEAGRLDRPALVVLPTSLIFNWKHEAARFAPGLRVLSLHGKERHALFAASPSTTWCSPPTPCSGATTRHWRSRSTTC